MKDAFSKYGNTLALHHNTYLSTTVPSTTVTSNNRGISIGPRDIPPKTCTNLDLCICSIPTGRTPLLLTVGGNTKGSKPAATRPAAKVRFAVDVEVLRTRTQATERNQQAPIKMVSGRAWSPGIYRALRLLKTLDVAWERAFIHSLTFN